jgi:hypothetical protein
MISRYSDFTWIDLRIRIPQRIRIHIRTYSSVGISGLGMMKKNTSRKSCESVHLKMATKICVSDTVCTISGFKGIVQLILIGVNTKLK